MTWKLLDRIESDGVEREVFDLHARFLPLHAARHEFRVRYRVEVDGWDECFKPDVWREAFDATGIDPVWYAHRERSPDEVFPWSHLTGGPNDDYLARQYDDVFTQIKIPRPQATLPGV